jgi:hypothetical protein
LDKISQFVAYFREMISNDSRSFIVIYSFLEFEQFEYWKRNKTEQKENFPANKSPKQNSSTHWLEP